MTVPRPYALTPLCVGILSSIAFQAVAAPEVTPGAVVDAEELAPFFEVAATRRVDVVGIGDSNQLFGGHGWDDGWIRALDDRFGTWATSLMSLGENDGNGANMGSGFRSYATRSSGMFQYTGAPAPLDDALRGVPRFSPLGYIYLADDDQITLGNHGLRVDFGGPIDVQGALRFSTSYGVSPSSTARTFRPFVRAASVPYTTIAISQTFYSITSPTSEVRRASLDIPAASRAFSLQFMIGPHASSFIGPFVGYYMRVEESETEHGTVFSTLYGRGGESARDMAQALLDLPNDTLTLYFDTLRSDQNGPPRLLVRINTGLNDRNEQFNPVGDPPYPATPDAPESFERNVRAIIDRIHAIWDSNGWCRDELYFLLAVSHPIGPTTAPELDDDPELIAYRAVARAVAESMPRCAAVDYNVLTNATEMAANFWYSSNMFDRAHLRENAYETLSARELAALQEGRTWLDVNADGVLDPEDLYAFEEVQGPRPADPSDASVIGLARALRFWEIDHAETGRD